MDAALTAMPYADVQNQGFLANSAFRSLHRLRDFSNRCFALRMHLQVANIFFGPGNSFATPICHCSFHSHHGFLVNLSSNYNDTYISS